MENLLGPRLGLQQGQLALPLSPSIILQQIAVQNIAEFSALVIESPKRFLRKRIDIASDEVTGQQATEILSNVLEYKIKYTPRSSCSVSLILLSSCCAHVSGGILTKLDHRLPTVYGFSFFV
jgi:hypothetical protein